MKSIIKLWLSVIVVCLSVESKAQGFIENALLFSRTVPAGSARMQAIGGAQVALGGDYSSALSNPAGLGMFNRSEFTFSPAVNSYKTNSTHLGIKDSDSKSVFNIPGLSLVYHYPLEKEKFLGGSFGISMTRINDFNHVFAYKGEDNASSIIDYFKEIASGHSIDPLPSPYQNTPILPFDVPVDLAYRALLIYPYADAPYPTPFTAEDFYNYTNYFSDLDTLWNNGIEELRTQTRSQHVNVKGAQYQWSFAYGGNFNDKFFFGASIGLTTLRYQFSTKYSESDYSFSESPEYDPLHSLRLDESIVIDGSGVNLTIGIIYRPVDVAQIGISLVTPTVYELSDTYSTRLRADWNSDFVGYGYRDVSSEPIISEYTFATPLKISTGAAFFLGRYGFISGDVEFINYGKAKYKSSTTDDFVEGFNPAIRQVFSNTINYRIGSEFRYSLYRIRAGYNYQGNPYSKEQSVVNHELKTISFGAGIKLKRYTIDGTWLQRKGNSVYSPYAFADNTGPVATLKNKMSSVMVTVGYRF
jgi:hypothetical protein